MTVLIISSIGDVHAQAVMAELVARGQTAELLDLAEFPLKVGLAMEYRRGTRVFRLRRQDGGELDLEQVTAAWWRRPQPFGIPPTITDAAARRFVVAESTTVFHGLYHSLRARWINDPAHDSVASHKPYQLTLAQEVGFEIPATLITNDPTAARAFWRENRGEVVHKQLVALPETWRETRRLTETEEQLAETIAFAPVLFQRHIPAAADVRVTVIGERVFAASVDASKGEYPLDVRMNANLRHSAHDLPLDIAHKVHALMQRLGLIYGALDFRLTPDGRYIFLEINPAGQFLYIEEDTGLRIAAALADELLRTNLSHPPPTNNRRRASAHAPPGMASEGAKDAADRARPPASAEA